MQKIIFLILFFLSLNQVYSRSLDRKDYPYALQTEDYGILNVEDFAMNSCDVDPLPFSGKHSPYPYWKCFPVSKTKFTCDITGNDHPSKEQNAVQIITVQDSDSEHFYMPRRATDVKNCHWFQKRWESATKGEKAVCISGAFSEYENENGHRTSIWVFDKFKTKKSCTSFFANACDLKAMKRNGCNI